MKWERLETKKNVQCDSIVHVCGYVYVSTHTVKEKKIEKKGTKMLIFYPCKEELLMTLRLLWFVVHLFDFTYVGGSFVFLRFYVFKVFSLSMRSFCNRK